MLEKTPVFVACGADTPQKRRMAEKGDQTGKDSHEIEFLPQTEQRGRHPHEANAMVRSLAFLNGSIFWRFGLKVTAMTTTDMTPKKEIYPARLRRFCHSPIDLASQETPKMAVVIEDRVRKRKRKGRRTKYHAAH